jgi:drug/metabolite transporter (DMT)-like permease
VDTRIGAYAALSGGFILAGSSVISGKLLSSLPVFFASAGGAAIALLALLPLAAGEAKGEPGALRRALPLLAAQAFFGVALFRVLMLAALTRTSAAEAGIATSATPAITALLSALFLRERIGVRSVSGIALAAIGIALLESGGVVSASAAGTALLAGSSLAGILLALGAAASESTFSVISKKMGASIGPIRASAFVMGLASAFLALLSLATGERIEWGTIGLARGLAFAYQGLFASALAYILFFTGIAKLPASTAGAFSSFIPLSSFALSVLLLGERPRAGAFVGCAVAVGGMLLCALPASRHP